jgi:putative nucleotidyltransferase with HDIG domain
MKPAHPERWIDTPALRAVSEGADALGVAAYVVGGYVRDHFLGRRTGHDLDVVVLGDAEPLARWVAHKLGGTKVSVFKSYGTAHTKTPHGELEFVRARKESYRPDSRNPEVAPGSLNDDQLRRDFTINALAIGLHAAERGHLLDPFNGQADLRQRILRTPLAPEATFSDDPLRMLRALRFAAQLEFSLHPDVEEALKTQAERISIITGERVHDELNKLLRTPKPSLGLAPLYTSGLMAHLLPEVSALAGVDEVEGHLHKDNFWHTLEVVDNVARASDNVWLRWAALLHDIGKPVTKRFIKGVGWTFHNHEFVGGKMAKKLFQRLRLPLNEKMDFVVKMVQMSSRPIAVVSDETTDSAVRRLLFDAGSDIEDLMHLCEADITTKNPVKKRRYLENFQSVRIRLVEVEEKDRLRNWQPPVDGAQLMQWFNLQPGPEIGILKNAIREAILDGEIDNTFESARALAYRRAVELGLTPAIPL